MQSAASECVVVSTNLLLGNTDFTLVKHCESQHHNSNNRRLKANPWSFTTFKYQIPAPNLTELTTFIK